MVVLIYVAKLFLKFIYFILKFFKTRDRIVFISRQQNDLSLDFKILKDAISKKYKNIEIVFVVKKIEKNFISAIKGIFIMFKQMYYLATSKVCIVDGYNIPVSILNHKKDLKVIQIWHSLAAIKKFGYQSLNTDYDKMQAKVLCMHKNYDYIISPSKETINYYSLAFGYSNNNFKVIGLPRMDYILRCSNTNKNKVYQKYPYFKNKKVILYVPTFRDNNDYRIDELINAIDLNKYYLIIKVHPNVHYNLDNKNVYTCDGFSSLQLLAIADFVITDYSAIALEASIIDKPLYFYQYDIDDYSKNPGINMDMNKFFNGYVFKNAKDLYKKLNDGKYDLNLVKKFKTKYIDHLDGNTTDKLCKFIISTGGFNEKYKEQNH